MEELASKKEVIQILNWSKNEITLLRKDNNDAHLRLKMFDDCMLLLNARQPSSLCGKSEDVVFRIDQMLNILTKKQE